MLHFTFSVFPRRSHSVLHIQQRLLRRYGKISDITASKSRTSLTCFFRKILWVLRRAARHWRRSYVGLCSEYLYRLEHLGLRVVWAV